MKRRFFGVAALVLLGLGVFAATRLPARASLPVGTIAASMPVGFNDTCSPFFGKTFINYDNAPMPGWGQMQVNLLIACGSNSSSNQCNPDYIYDVTLSYYDEATDSMVVYDDSSYIYIDATNCGSGTNTYTLTLTYPQVTGTVWAVYATLYDSDWSTVIDDQFGNPVSYTYTWTVD